MTIQLGPVQPPSVQPFSSQPLGGALALLVGSLALLASFFLSAPAEAQTAHSPLAGPAYGAPTTSTPAQAAPMAATPSEEETLDPLNVYVFSVDFPPDRWMSHPKPAVAETQYYQTLKQAFDRHPLFALTSNFEASDYRVDVTCAGVQYCTKLKIDIMNPERETLVSTWIPGRKRPWHKLNIEKKTVEIAEAIQQRILGLANGAYGAYDDTKPKPRLQRFEPTPQAAYSTSPYAEAHSASPASWSTSERSASMTGRSSADTYGYSPRPFNPPVYRQENGWNPS